jgi:cobalt-zinc-cadmium efflux system outer membrane protein
MLAVSFLILSASPAPLDLGALAPGASLSPGVWQFAPDLQEARARVAASRAEADRAQLLPNPQADLAVGTIPVGPLNPPELKDPLLNVPNVSVGVSVLVELGKRGPRQAVTSEAARATRLEAAELLRQRVLALKLAIADVAAAEVRVATLKQLVADAEGLVSLQRARAEKGDASSLDADRAQLEQETTRAALGESLEAVESALRSCTELAGVTCLPFGDSTKAAAWLEEAVPAGKDPSRRFDLLALEAAARSADAAITLAHNKGLPDLTVRAGYVHDRFVISGNQQNSLFVGVSVPMPVFDHGQTDARAATEAQRAAVLSRERLTATLPEMLARIEKELDALEARHTRLHEQALPLGQSVVERLSAAVTRGAAPLPELLLARRSWSELLLLTNDLHRANYGLRVERARLTGAPIDLPPELSDEN